MVTVLVVDDEEYMRGFLTRFAKRFGFESVAAENGEDALKLCRQTKPALVFLDIMLPDMHGEKVFKAMKEMDKNLKICFISGSEFEINKMKMLALGADGFLSKPLDMEDIKKVFESVK